MKEIDAMTKTRLTVALLAILVAVATVLVAPPKAQAAPWYCRWWPQASGCSTVPPTTTTTPTTTQTTTPTTTTTVSTIPTTTTTSPPPPHFTTAPSGQCPRTGACAAPTNLPRTDAYCAANITPTTWEPRTDNNTANNTPGPSDPSVIPWGPYTISAGNYWANADTNQRQVTGNYTGLTTQIIQWTACKWGLDEDLIRAQAVQESSWHQSQLGDYATGCYHSFGILQVRDAVNGSCPINHNARGGMPYTQNSTALNLDTYGAAIRSCYDGDYNDNGSWLYGGKSVTQIAATNGWDYVLWGCVGYWFSGNWYDSGAQSYINSVKTHLANRTWESY